MDLTRDLPLLLALVGFVATAALLGAAEAALLRVPPVRVAVEAERDGRRARMLLRLVDDLPRVVNGVLLAVLLVQIAAATVTGILAERAFGNLGATAASVVLTLVLFVYAEAIPKTYAIGRPLRVALATAPLITAIDVVLRPVVSLLVAAADLQTPGHGVGASLGVSEDELRRLAAMAASAGEIEESDRRLLERAFVLGDLRAADVLVPRTDVVAVTDDVPVAEALRVALRSGHRRLPVHTGDLDDVSGFVRLRDLAEEALDDPRRPVGTLAREAIVVPESGRVVDLLTEMQRRGVHLATVVDEHGGVSGIVTIEDIVAELVGSVADEGEVRRPQVEVLGPDRWRVSGSTDVADLEAALGATLPEGPWRSVGGLVAGLLGRIPAVGDAVDVADFHLLVRSMGRRRVEEVLVVRRPESERR